MVFMANVAGILVLIRSAMSERLNVIDYIGDAGQPIG